MELLNNLFYFLIVFGILVNIHEFGHFIAARISGMRVDIFSFGMGYRLFGWNRKYGFSFGKIPDDFEDDGVTDYRVSLLPIGGYVKIAGMIDESNDTDFLSHEPKPWEFRSKNAFLKGFTISAGVIMNALLAIAFFAIIILAVGRTSRLTTEVVSADSESVSEAFGIKAGDKILAVDGSAVDSWDDMINRLVMKDLGKNKVVKIERDSSIIEITTDGSKAVKMMVDAKSGGLNPKGSVLVCEMVETIKPAAKTGLKDGDTILSVNNIAVYSPVQLKNIVTANKETPIPIVWKHGDEIKKDTVKPDADGMIGVALSQLFNGETKKIEYGVGEAIVWGYNETIRSIDLFLNSMAQIFNGNIQAKQALGGPIMIAKQASHQAENGIYPFMNFMALLSITLAFINILPFPALDGGHLLFIIIEAIIRKEIPVKAKLILQQVGFGLLMLLMAYVVYIDLTR